MTSEIIRKINSDTGVSQQRIEAAIQLIQEGATIPFIARYRKEATGNLDEANLRRIAERYLAHGTLIERRAEILSAIEAQGRLTPQLRTEIESCETPFELEDLYLPYRPKRQSKANLARRRGLEPLAEYILKQAGPTPAEDLALRFISIPKKVTTVAAAIEGALHIVAERLADDTSYRKWLRDLMVSDGKVEARVVKDKEGQKTKYSTYYEFAEAVSRIPSHRMLAIRRGAREKVLSYSIQIDDEKACSELRSRTPIDPEKPSAELIGKAIFDAYERLLKPVIQNEIRTMLRERAEGEAIAVFEENLSALLLAPPAGAITVLGIDPSLKGASRLAVVAPDGSLVERHALRLAEAKPASAEPPAEEISNAETVPDTSAEPVPSAAPAAPAAVEPGANPEPATEAVGTTAAAADPEAPSPPEEQEAPTADSAAVRASTTVSPPPAGSEPVDARKALADLLKRANVRGVVIGNGSGSREAETFVRSTVQDTGADIFVLVANEAGAGVYAASRNARQEFPDLDVATRRALSFARRLQDPLAELVRIDPKSIGVGQYQHDVDQAKLKASLEAAVESAVNRVGVDLNSASQDLLRYVSGFSAELADKVVDYRTANGSFSTREDMRNVEGIDDRVFTQAAGFLRIQGGGQALDRTSIHPESYPVVEKMAESVGVSPDALVGNSERIRSIHFEDFEKDAGRYTLDDIRRELTRPGLDPRKTFAVPRFRSDIRDISDLKDGLELEGTVTNVTNFGAFVDVGVGQDGLVHISELSHRYVSDARQAVQVGDVVKVKVIGVDSKLKRISLSAKAAMPKPAAPTRPRRRPGSGDSERGERGKGRIRRPKTREAAVSTKSKARRASTDGRETTATPARQVSMEEKIRMLQEKFKGPDR